MSGFSLKLSVSTVGDATLVSPTRGHPLASAATRPGTAGFLAGRLTRWIRQVSLYGYPREPEPVDDDESPAPAPGTYLGAGVIPAQRPAVGNEPVSPAEASGRHRIGMPEINGAGPDDFAWLRPPLEQPGFGPSPTMGQPAVSRPSPAMGQPIVAPPVSGAPVSASPISAAPVQTGPSAAGPYGADPSAAGPHAAGRAAGGGSPMAGAPVAAPAASALMAPPAPATRASASPTETDAALAALLDEPEIQPWDRRPLLVVIASVIVLVLIGIAAGVATASLAQPNGGVSGVSWREPDPGATPGEG